MINEKQNWKSIAKCEFTTLNKNDSKTKFAFTNIDVKNQLNHEVRKNEKIHASSRNLETFAKMKKSSTKIISNEYKKWKTLF